jgi:hypothetical protein
LSIYGGLGAFSASEMPTVQAHYDQFRNDPTVTFLIISRLDSPETVRRYARRNHFDPPFYTTDDADIPASMQLNQFPATFLYSPDGTMMVKHTGAADWSAPAVVSYINDLKTKRWGKVRQTGRQPVSRCAND